MDYDFDRQLQLRGTHSSKYDAIGAAFGRDDPDMIPMWVADMDFAAPPKVLEALQGVVDLGYMGYFTNPKPVAEAVANWYASRHGWSVDPGWVRFTHGVVNGFGVALATLTEPGDEVIVFSPVYHAFFRQTEAMGRVVFESELVERDEVFHMDLDGLASSLTGRQKALVLCSPHNPGGRLWTAEEIRELVTFCKEHDLWLISDEIHMDLVHPGAKFLPTAVAAPEASDRLVVLNAASKAFNLAGGETGLMIVPDANVRRRVDKVMVDREASPNRFGMMMIKAAYDECGDWSDAVRDYLAENFRIFAERINALPGVSVMPMQATYLSWVDFTDLGMGDDELMTRLLDAKVAPSPGTQFRKGGSGHMRFNVALPRPTLLEAISRIESAFSDLQ